jgi:dephospho-CoA kinase
MITKVNIIEVIQKHVELPGEAMDKLAKDLYEHIAPFLPKIKEPPTHVKVEGEVGFTVKDLEEILVAVQKLKDIHSTIEPKYIEDTLYVDQLKRLEFNITEVLFKHK